MNIYTRRNCDPNFLQYLGAIGGRGSAETFNTILTEVNCLGNESLLLECSVVNTEVCASQEIATVICQGTVLYIVITPRSEIKGMLNFKRDKV